MSGRSRGKNRQGAKKFNNTVKPSKDGTYDDAREFVADKMKDVFT